jgi:hypothetical protein
LEVLSSCLVGRVATTQLTFVGRTEISHLEVSELKGKAQETMCVGPKIPGIVDIWLRRAV